VRTDIYREHDQPATEPQPDVLRRGRRVRLAQIDHDWRPEGARFAPLSRDPGRQSCASQHL